jgi:phospholipase/carboxylesterase
VTALVGFSQGAILALETAQAEDGLAGRVLAFGGRYAVLPDHAPRETTLHLLHGAQDTVMPARHAREALDRLGQLGGDATLDIAEGVGHELHPVLMAEAIRRLRTHIPYRTWQAALGAVPSVQGGRDAH